MTFWVCARCKTSLKTPSSAMAQAQSCPSCGLEHKLEGNRISYAADPLLRQCNPRKWRLWKVLNNNGYLSYEWLPQGSLSLPDREDVMRFRDFIESNFRRGSVLDIGCGTLEVPGYLNFKDAKDVALLGLDPIGNSKFKGPLAIGVSEYLPWATQTVDNVVFATSLDHVCLLDETLREAHRVLHPDGRLFVWMGDRSMGVWEWIKLQAYQFLRLFVRPERLIERLRLGFDLHRYQEHENGVVFYIPRGAVDAFHQFRETPAFVTAQMKKNGFRLVTSQSHHKGEAFLVFQKA